MDILDRPRPDPSFGPVSVPADAVRRPLVLLVEDDATLRDIVQRNLEVHGYRVQAADSAASALAALRHEAPAALLLDINLPDGSGWDVLRAARAQGQRVPTVVVSAVRCNRERLAEFRPDAYLPKPFPMAALVDAIERLAGTGTTTSPEREGGSDMDVETPAALPGLDVVTSEESGYGGPQEPVTYHVPRSRRNRPCVAGAEPVTYRVPRRRRGSADAGSAVGVIPASRRTPVSALNDSRLTAPGPIEQAMCDLLANPASGITRITVVGASPASVATLEGLAAKRGLRAVAATSPSLQRGWIRLARRTREPLNGDEDAPTAPGEPDVVGSQAALRRGTFLQRIRRQLQTATAGLFA